MTYTIPSHGYVGRCKCGKVNLLCGDERNSDTANSVADVISRGGTIDRMTIEACRAAAVDFGCVCPEEDSRG